MGFRLGCKWGKGAASAVAPPSRVAQTSPSHVGHRTPKRRLKTITRSHDGATGLPGASLGVLTDIPDPERERG